MQADFDTQTRLGQCLYPCPHVVCMHSVGQWCVYTYDGVQALVMHFDPTYLHVHAKVKYLVIYGLRPGHEDILE